MRKHLTNAAYGVLDYAAYPFGMLLAAPVVLHKLGAAEYGVWAIATAAVSTGGIVASGFTDANIQRVAKLSGAADRGKLEHAVRSMMSINLVLGTVIAIAAWLLAPFATRHIEAGHLSQQHACLVALRIGSVMILVRAVESVIVSTQRALMRYRDAVQISTAVRLLTLGSAAALAFTGHRTVSIMISTAFYLTAGTFLQFRCLRRFLGGPSLWPVFEPDATRALLGFGIFSWFQALGSVIFGQFDRVVLGFSLGAIAVAPYSLCVQFAQPLFGLTASSLQFLFPFLAGRFDSASPREMNHTLWKAFACNVLIVAAGAAALLLVGNRLIRTWAGPAVARSAAPIFPLIVLSAALMGLSVTGTYAMLALGRVRTLALLSMSSRALMLAVMAYLVRHAGMSGLVLSRVGYGALSLLLYVPLVRLRSTRPDRTRSFAAEIDITRPAPPHLATYRESSNL